MDTTEAELTYDCTMKVTCGLKLGDLTTSRKDLVKPGLMSEELGNILTMVNFVILCKVISFFGILTNTLNIIVFVRQGFQDSTNISLFGLAISDLLCLVTALWTCIGQNPLFDNPQLRFSANDVVYLSGGVPHECFSRITSFITAFITLERCLCVIKPLKVKTIITPGRTKIIIASIYLIMFIAFSPFYGVNRLEWKFSMSLNNTVLSLAVSENKHMVESVIFIIHSVALSTIAYAFVVICTGILVAKLNKKTKWRHSVTGHRPSKSENVSAKDKKLVKIVTLISIIFIICFIPATANFLVMSSYPDFSFVGRYKTMFEVVWSFTFVLEVINSSVNIFVYFRVSTKFRVTFTQIFCWSTQTDSYHRSSLKWSPSLASADI